MSQCRTNNRRSAFNLLPTRVIKRQWYDVFGEEIRWLLHHKNMKMEKISSLEENAAQIFVVFFCFFLYFFLLPYFTVSLTETTDVRK